PRGHAPLQGGRARDRRVLQHGRIRRRHPRVLLHPGPPRPRPPRRRLVPRAPGRRAPHDRGRSRRGRRRPGIQPAPQDLPNGRPMRKIERLEVHDVRFPTAAEADGSDSINRADYSATYVELSTDGGPPATGFTFTGGRGNAITCAAVRSFAHLVVGRTLEGIFDDPVEFSRSLAQEPQIRWLAPEKGATHMAVGAIVNAVWDLRAKIEGKPM